MSKSVNKSFILGNLGQDPDLRYTANGIPVANLNVATNESYKDGEGNLVDKVEWHRIVVWGKTAENCGQYLKKGSRVHIEGSLQTRSYEDSEGITRYTTEIKARDITFLDSSPNSGTRPPHPADSEPAKTKSGSTPKAVADFLDEEGFEPDEELPF